MLLQLAALKYLFQGWGFSDGIDYEESPISYPVYGCFGYRNDCKDRQFYDNNGLAWRKYKVENKINVYDGEKVIEIVGGYYFESDPCGPKECLYQFRTDSRWAAIKMSEKFSDYYKDFGYKPSYKIALLKN